MAGDGALSGVLARVFADWAHGGIRYAVLRNYEGSPERIGADVDVVVHRDDLAHARVLVERAAAAHAFRCATREQRTGYVTHQLVPVALNGNGDGIVLDVRPDLMHGGFSYLPGETVVATRQRHGAVYVPSPALESLALLLHCVIHARTVRASHRRRLCDLGVGDAAEFRRAASAAVGDGLAGRLAVCLIRGEPERALLLRGRLLRACAWRHRDALTRWLKARGGALWDRARATLRPPGHLVVLLGPDGSGKTTTAELVARRLAHTGIPVTTVYLGAQMPLLPTRRLSQRLRRRLAKPRAIPAIRDVTRRQRLRGLLHVLADKWLRYLVYVRPRLVRGDVVVLDRYFYDLRTYQHPLVRRASVEALMMRVIPRPALAFCLTANPAVIAVRKGELTVAETARQLECYRGIGRWLPNFYEVPADGDLPSVVRWMNDQVVRLYSGAPAEEAGTGCDLAHMSAAAR